MINKIKITNLSKTEDYIAKEWAQVLSRRAHFLNSSDWTQLPDVGLSDSAVSEWRAWREMVRYVSKNIHSLDEAGMILDDLELSRPNR